MMQIIIADMENSPTSLMEFAKKSILVQVVIPSRFISTKNIEHTSAINITLNLSQCQLQAIKQKLGVSQIESDRVQNIWPFENCQLFDVNE